MRELPDYRSIESTLLTLRLFEDLLYRKLQNGSMDQQAYQEMRAEIVEKELGRRLRNTGCARHNEDFSTVYWFGKEYSFTARQAACVRLLWQAWENGTPEVNKQALLTEAESNGTKLIWIFRNRNGKHPAWGSFIVKGHPGTYRLAEPKK